MNYPLYEQYGKDKILTHWTTNATKTIFDYTGPGRLGYILPSLTNNDLIYKKVENINFYDQNGKIVNLISNADHSMYITEDIKNNIIYPIL